jgi:hypothetical protein
MMELKRAFQIAEELASWGFNEGTGDPDFDDDEARKAMDALWMCIQGYLEIVTPINTEDPIMPPEEIDAALEWVKDKPKWV